MEEMILTESAYNNIINTVGATKAESGGILFGKEDDNIIQEFHFDENAKVTRVTYEINVKSLNPIIKRKWDEEGLSVIGILHSHPHGISNPSMPDIEYFKKISEIMPREKLLVPIVFTIPDGGFKFHPHIFSCDGQNEIHQAKLKVISDSQYQATRSSTLKSKLLSKSVNRTLQLTDFSRIEKAVDIEHLENSHVVIVGAGGAFGLYESLARCGVGKITAIDFDKVEESNLVRQGFDLKHIGKFKVDAIRERLRQINRGVKLRTVKKDVTKLSKRSINTCFKDGDIFLFLTDSFEAQALGNKIALHYQKPAIWAGFYEKSQCSEIVFYIPIVTPACFRCTVSPRYLAQVEMKKNGQNPNPNSQSNTIFHSMLLDAQIGMLTMAILHNKTKGYEFSNWFGENWERNLIQMKVNPAYNSPLFDNLKEASQNRSQYFSSVWQEIKQETTNNGYDNCPDCITS